MEAIFVLSLLGVVGAGGYALYRRRSRLRRLHDRVSSFRMSAVATVHGGAVGLQGVARPLELIRAPLSGVEVIGYRVTVEQYGTGASWSGSKWGTELDLSLLRPFEVEDSSGRALVQPGGSVLLLKRESRDGNGFFANTPDRVKDLLARHGRTAEGLLLEKKLRWSEYLLEPGERVFVAGEASRELDPRAQGGGFRDAPKRVVIRAPAHGQLIIADRFRGELLKSLKLDPDLPPTVGED